MNSRRNFIKSTAFASAIGLWHNEVSNISKLVGTGSEELDWEAIRALFPITSWDKIHLNSGSAGVMPIMVEDHLISLSKIMNRMAPYEAWELWQDELGSIKQRLSTLINCKQDHISLVRNTTEGLNTISSGLQLSDTDEIIIAAHDYPYARHTWNNSGHRNNAIIKAPKVNLPAIDDEIIAAYRKCISPKTRVMHITHMTHREGHILPVKALIELAQKHNIVSVVDGAHTIGHFPLDLSILQPDCYVSSLHKWLNAPHGNGLLYISPRVLNLMHLYPSAPVVEKDKFLQFTHLGTRAFHVEIAISAALDFHAEIGAIKKYNRLQFLKHHWTNQLKDHPKIKWHTNLSDSKSCGIVTIGIAGKSAGQIVNSLNKKYNIHAKPVDVKDGGVRISPNIFTSTDELDQLVVALRDLAS